MHNELHYRGTDSISILLMQCWKTRT